MSYLLYVCLFVHSGVKHILCCVFLRLMYPMLPVSLDCPFWIAPSVFIPRYLVLIVLLDLWYSVVVFFSFFFRFLLIIVLFVLLRLTSSYYLSFFMVLSQLAFLSYESYISYIYRLLQTILKKMSRLIGEDFDEFSSFRKGVLFDLLHLDYLLG